MVYELVIGNEVHPLTGRTSTFGDTLRWSAIANPGVLVMIRKRHEDGTCVFVSGNCPPHDVPRESLYVGA